ncbi:MAG: aminotransferase [Bacteroidetes bacterium B1(2017)]|nr:MAG: aminotransferase [Bacteroidetes bacterium B1(2017)]
MQFSKRQFIKLAAMGAFWPFESKSKSILDVFEKPNFNAPFTGNWDEIRSHYVLKKDYINLENGYYSILAQPILEAYLEDIRKVNLEGSYYMRTVQFENKLNTKKRLAQYLGCEPEELIITRNTTESLDTIISGKDWKPGDEAIMAQQDYGSMLDMFKQQAQRYGLVNKLISIPIDPKTDEEIVDLYAQEITPKTRLIMVCQMINISGQILPIKKICEMAHSRGVKVMVDGAHAVSHINFKISELGCDYYGSSLHKWLGCPLGAGILYVSKENIEPLWPIYGEYSVEKSDISKLNHTGTHPVATDIAINHALDYAIWLGIEQKEKRLRYLQNYWMDKLRDQKNIILNTPLDKSRSCGIGNVKVFGLGSTELAKILLNQYKIWTVAINTANIHGIRVTPHLYTTEKELDTFVSAMIEISKVQNR